MSESEVLLRDKLHQFIDNLEVEKIQEMYLMFEEEIEVKISSQFKLTEAEISDLDKQRENYLNGNAKVHTWNEVETELRAILKK